MAGHIHQSRKLKLLKKVCLPRMYNVLLAEVHDLLEKEKNKKKRKWVRDWIARRDKFGASAHLFKELADEDIMEFKMCLRMSPENFQILLDLVTPKIEKQDTQMRDAIPPKIKLEVTLNFLATGNSYRSLQHFFRVSKPAISNFIPEVCDAIYESLREFIKVSLFFLRY